MLSRKSSPPPPPHWTLFVPSFLQPLPFIRKGNKYFYFLTWSSLYIKASLLREPNQVSGKILMRIQYSLLWWSYTTLASCSQLWRRFSFLKFSDMFSLSQELLRSPLKRTPLGLYCGQSLYVSEKENWAPALRDIKALRMSWMDPHNKNPGAGLIREWRLS